MHLEKDLFLDAKFGVVDQACRRMLSTRSAECLFRNARLFTILFLRNFWRVCSQFWLSVRNSVWGRFNRNSRGNPSLCWLGGGGSRGTKIVNKNYVNKLAFPIVGDKEPCRFSELHEYYYTQNDYRTELYYFRIIFGSSRSAITEPKCFWNYSVSVRRVSRGLPNPLPNCLGFIFGNLGGGITEQKLFWN